MTKAIYLLILIILIPLSSCGSGGDQEEPGILEGSWMSQCIKFSELQKTKSISSKVNSRIGNIDLDKIAPYSFQDEKVFNGETAIFTFTMYSGLECDPEVVHYSNEVKYKYNVELLSPANHINYVRFAENVAVFSDIGKQFMENTYPGVEFELNSNTNIFKGNVNNSFYDIFLLEDGKLYFSISPMNTAEERRTLIDKGIVYTN